MSKKLCYLMVILAMAWAVCPAFGQAPKTATGSGNILVERWMGGGVDSNLDNLKNNSNYPNNPASSFWDTDYDQPDISSNDYWGERYRGYLWPPQTGDYTFWIASDDDSELWLSTDDNPANIKMICSVEGWTDYQIYDGTSGSPGSNQKSQVVKLEAGKRYYTEAMFSDGTGGGHMSVAWQGPGIASRAMIAGKYLSPLIRDPEPMLSAKDPVPADGATGVIMPGIVFLSWTPGATAKAHDVYFGTNPNPSLVPPRLGGAQTTFISMAPLVPGQTYYWRVDEVEADMKTIRQGKVWSFTAAPLSAFSPSPRNGDKWLDPQSDLIWMGGTDAVAHDVYFGTDKNAVANRDASVKMGNKQAGLELALPTLAAGTTYYWLVDEYDSLDVKHEGEVWSFTTLDPASPGGVKGEYFASTSRNVPSVMPNLTRIDPAIDFAWGDPGNPGGGLGDNYFSARWTADLEIAVADTYTFIGTSDDGIRVWLNDNQIIDAWVDRAASDTFSAAQKLEPGIYSLRVDYYEWEGGASAQLSWQTPTVARQIVPAGPLQPPVRAKPINPQNGDANVPQDITLMWSAGEKAVSHNVYFGEDAAAVAAATPADAAIYKGNQALDKNTFIPGALQWNKTYYWRVDEVNTAETGSPWKSAVWSFTTADFLVVDNFESYTNDSPNRVFQTWIDGYGFSPDDFFPKGSLGNGSGAMIGYDPQAGDIMEKTIVHGGSQAMPVDYNNVISPFYSQIDRAWTSPQNWKINGVNTLLVHFQGFPVRFQETATGISMSAQGTDIQAGVDEFRFAYKTLTGDGSITVRVDSALTANVWTKAGVMVRDHLEPLAMQMHMIAAPQQSLVEWMYRALDNDTVVTNFNTAANSAPLPVWLRITRAGNVFTGEYSTNGTTWTKITNTADNTTTSTYTNTSMPSTVYIGLVVTSHQPGVSATADFSNVRTTGNVTGAWKVKDMGVDHKGNDADQLYVALKDNKVTKPVVVKHPDPKAVLSTGWTAWEIPLSDFAGVNASAVTQISIGVGDSAAPKPDGFGRLFIDDIRVIKK